MAKPTLWGLDAFANGPFTGNPAAVCHLDAPANPDWMQRVAAEMNLSETAFLIPTPDGWGIRWFTPLAEVALCGHATLASAHFLWQSGLLALERSARFFTQRSGELVCHVRDGRIEMDFPARLATEAPIPDGLAEALGVEPIWVGRSADDHLVQVGNENTVRGLRPNLAVIGQLPVRGVIVTARGDGVYDCVSRFFAPAVGVPEDPVTGSAHCTLAPFWSERIGKKELRAWQASRRGGEVHLRVAGSRVFLGGSAVTVWRGEVV